MGLHEWFSEGYRSSSRVREGENIMLTRGENDQQKKRFVVALSSALAPINEWLYECKQQRRGASSSAEICAPHSVRIRGTPHEWFRTLRG
jgi:hypothetical protein